MGITRDYQDWHDLQIVVTDLKLSLKSPLWELVLIISKGAIQTAKRENNLIALSSCGIYEPKQWPPQ